MPPRKDLNAWLQYTIHPQRLKVTPRSAHWGNGQLQLLAQLRRPAVENLVCFGYGPEGLHYQRVEEHLIPAVYDAQTGKKYLLSSSPVSGAREATVTFRPDRQVWRYEFDDLVVDVSLILPRLLPGYLLKVELSPTKSNTATGWRLYQERRGVLSQAMRITDADFDPHTGTVWLKSDGDKLAEALGSTLGADSAQLSKDGACFRRIMVKMLVKRDGRDSPTSLYCARSCGPTVEDAKAALADLLSSPEKLEAETQTWWNTYLNDLPQLETPDESFSKSVFWSWPDFRMNRIDVPIGNAPPGLFNINNLGISTRICMMPYDNAEAEAFQLLNDPRPARALMLFLLKQTAKEGVMRRGVTNGLPEEASAACTLGYFCGLMHKYMLTTGDMALLEEDIGGMAVLQRLEDALEAQLNYRDDKTGLLRIDDEFSSGLRPLAEHVTPLRGAGGSFHSDANAVFHGALLAMADIEDLAGNGDRSKRYRDLAQDLQSSIQAHMWNDQMQFFCDLQMDGTVSDYMGIGGFLTGLFANQVYRPGGLATKEQADKLTAWCTHPDFVSDLGVISLARSNPYFDPEEYKGFNSGFDYHWCTQIPAGLYAHGCYQEAHSQLFKLFRRVGENGGLGPRYRGESYNSDTGEILPWRFANYPASLNVLSAVIEGVFGLRWTSTALKVQVNSPWPWANLRNLKIRDSMLDLELSADENVSAIVDGKEVAKSSDRKLELPWELFEALPHNP
jgi:hypothetical protein